MKQILRSKVAFWLPGLLLLAAACSQPDAEPASEARAISAPATATPTATVGAAAPLPTPELAIEGIEVPPLRPPAEQPPKIDVSIASVPLEKVIFDTFSFGNRELPLPDASEAKIEELRDAIVPIYVPRYDGVAGGAWLGAGDLVIGYEGVTQAYAYPIKIMAAHEIVDDVIDGMPLLVSYCPLCASGMVHSRILDDQVLLFGNTSALFESDMVMYDHETGSYWHQVAGAAIVGPLTGKRLTLLTSQTMTWGMWKKLHPDTSVLSIDQGLFPLRGNPYDRDPQVGYAERVNQGKFVFPVSQEKLDGRLPFGQEVLSIEIGGRIKAYPLSRDSDWLLNDVFEGEKVVVIGRSEGPSATAYLSTVDRQTLTFRLVDGILEDNETGSKWDEGGRAVAGQMAGARLVPVPSLTSFWFSIVGAVPEIELYMP